MQGVVLTTPTGPTGLQGYNGPTGSQGNNGQTGSSGPKYDVPSLNLSNVSATYDSITSGARRSLYNDVYNTDTTMFTTGVTGTTTIINVNQTGTYKIDYCVTGVITSTSVGSVGILAQLVVQLNPVQYVINQVYVTDSEGYNISVSGTWIGDIPSGSDVYLQFIGLTSPGTLTFKQTEIMDNHIRIIPLSIN